MSASAKKISTKQREALVIKVVSVDEAMGAVLHEGPLPKGRCLNNADIDSKLICGFMGHASIKCTLLYAQPNIQEVKARVRRLREYLDQASGLPIPLQPSQDSNICEEHHGDRDEKDPC